MNTSIKKEITHIRISYKDGDYSNNLYCSEIVLINGETNSLEMNFKNILKSRIMANSNYDLNNLRNNFDSLEKICFNDATISKILIKKLKQNEEINVRLIIDKTYNLISQIIFISKEEFILKIINH
ncbi:MAG: hypothetical protein H6Q18_108 [Bacteroidetes bacterium]|nr:hypothetical protein [Bacteroidota bacterium]